MTDGIRPCHNSTLGGLLHEIKIYHLTHNNYQESFLVANVSVIDQSHLRRYGFCG